MGNGNGGNGDGVVMKPTTLLLNLLERQAISETQLSTLLEEQNEAKVSRRLIHTKLDEMGRTVAGLTEKVGTTSDQVAKIAPQVADHERLRQTFSGALIVIGSIASVVMVAIGFVLKDLWGWIAQHVFVRWS